jgi:hypothetical protein
LIAVEDMRPRIAATALAVLAGLTATAGSADAAQRTWFAQSPDSAGGPFRVKPAKVYFGAGGGLSAARLHWSRWREPTAEGRGVAVQRVCRPNCAEGRSRRDPARLRLSRPGQLEGRRQYRCWRLTILRGPNRGVAARGCRPGAAAAATCQQTKLFLRSGIGQVIVRRATCRRALRVLHRWVDRGMPPRGPRGWRCRHRTLGDEAPYTKYRCARGKARMRFAINP